jgi:hypothetical protein
MGTLAQLRVSDTRGVVCFEIVVSDGMTMFNLHRVLQYCIKPRQGESAIDCRMSTSCMCYETFHKQQ